MRQEHLTIGGVPAILWGEPSGRLFIHVHGKMSRKEYAEQFAMLAEQAGWQTLSFDLPEHGERADRPERCDVWNGVRDLTAIADWAFARYAQVSLYACSLGAYFSLMAYADRCFERCLFQSPVVDMQWLVRQMMVWSGVTEAELQQRGEIPTDLDTLRWDYYQYILAHPVERWPHKTFVLYGALDDLQPMSSISSFTDRFGCTLTVSPQSRHPFMEPQDFAMVNDWIKHSLAPEAHPDPA